MKLLVKKGNLHSILLRNISDLFFNIVVVIIMIIIVVITIVVVVPYNSAVDLTLVILLLCLSFIYRPAICRQVTHYALYCLKA